METIARHNETPLFAPEIEAFLKAQASEGENSGIVIGREDSDRGRVKKGMRSEFGGASGKLLKESRAQVPDLLGIENEMRQRFLNTDADGLKWLELPGWKLCYSCRS